MLLKLLNRMTARFILVAATLIFCLCCLCRPATAVNLPKVLVLNSYHENYAWTERVLAGIKDVFADQEFMVELYVEYMDTKRQPPEQAFPILLDLYRAKFKDSSFQVVIATDDNAYQFLLRYRDILFPGTPVVFCGVNNFDPEQLSQTAGFTGVVEKVDIAGAMERILTILPETRRIVVVSDATVTGGIMMEEARDIAPSYSDKAEIVFYDDFSGMELKQLLAHEPPNTAVLLLSFFRDRTGQAYSASHGVRMLSRACDCPVFVTWEFMVGSGSVGGYLTSGHLQGELAAQLAMRVLKGEDPANIRILIGDQSIDIYDYEVLSSLGIPLSALPDDSRIINEPQTFYWQHRKLYWVVTVVIVTLVVLVVVLSMNILRRIRAEQGLAEQLDFLQILLDTMPNPVYYQDKNGFFQGSNRAFESLVGKRKSEIIGKDVETLAQGTALTWALGVDDEMWEEQGSQIFEIQMDRPGGGSANMVVNRAVYELGGKVASGVVGVLQDITGRKRMEDELRDAHERFLTILESLDAAIYVMDMESYELLFVNNYLRERISENPLGRRCWETLFPSQNGPCSFCAAQEMLATWPDVLQESGREMESYLGGRWYHGWDRAIKWVNGRPAKIQIATDITEFKRAQEALARSEKKFRGLYEMASEGIMLYDTEGRIMDCNSHAIGLFGYSLDELQGLTTMELIHPDDVENVNSTFSIVRKGHTVRDEFRIRRKDGEYLAVDVSIKMVDDNMMQAIIRDISERKRLERELVRAKIQAEEANQAKSLFLANMSHEIRTPISGIIGMSEMILRQELMPGQRDRLEMVKESARSLLEIINDILDFSKIEAQKLKLYPADFSLRPAMDTFLKPFRVQAEKKGIDLTLGVAPDVPENLKGDRGRLGQIVANLVGNAIKFTDNGGVNVQVNNAQSANGAIRLSFSVSDTGIGIPEDKLDTVFSLFTQVDSSTSKEYMGTGLGLAISKQLVEMMNGRIWVESEPGHGSKFHFTAELQPGAGQDHADLAESSAVRAEPLSILLAEDNPINQEFIAHFLSEDNHRVKTVDDGRKVLRTLEREDFDLVLMDVQMPKMDGLEATREIRMGRVARVDRDIPIIALTAYAMKGDRERFISAGMDGYVSKPVDFDELAQAISRVTKRSGLKVAAPTGEAGPKAASIVTEPVQGGVKIDFKGLPRVDKARALDGFGGNQELFERLLDLFKKNSGGEVLAIRESLEAGDMDNLAKGVHALKSGAATLCLERATVLAKALERAARDQDADLCRSLMPLLEREVEVVVETL